MPGTQILGVPIGSMGFGLMGFTWRPKITPDDQAFAVMKRAVDLGATFFNGGEFYGSVEPTLNLDLINRFFTKYPEYADKVVLSIKGGVDLKTLSPDGRPEAVRASVNNVLKHLGGAKKLDVFECARVDKNVPIETTISALAEMVKEGLIGGISLSEVGVESIKRAANVHPIAAVEVEYSLWSLEAYELGVLKTCAELGIPVVAYAPLGRGFLTGQIRSRADIGQGDFRLYLDRFSQENFPLNLQLVDEVVKLAEKKGIKPSQLALSWVKKHEEIIPGLSIIPIPGATTLDRIEENYASVPALTDEEFAEIGEILKKFEVRGGRYNTHASAHLWG
ncbi:NADP-dependent oxidoreductase domain-containing protein [Lipomyces tetrasporus]|uniref:NADP-dependent oxidoreductase domain-containing protein n=1 Tax=Lipomyces tetrasporus TaxID=54092 RepID=A0AAD7VVT0_9ASCO|nr:NADP-dependent oxidoreductase domain-containing protein [Lipomyces tetrasporus]KAJ8103838.1 NADP-dependent oxidoreductase domain-containing protein [Lipomyces tetrasporus]